MQNTPELDSGKISSSQFVFAILLYIQASSLLLAFATSILRSETWIAFVFASIVSIPIFLVFISLMKNFPKSDLFSINEMVYGKTAGKIISAMYLWFFVTLTSLNLRDLGDFVKQFILLRTPEVVIIGVFIFVCGFAVRQGIKGVIRYTTLTSVIVLVATSITLILLFGSINFKNLLPMFDYPAEKYIQTTHLMSAIPLGELVIFLMLSPNIEFKRKAEVGKKWFLGVLSGVIFMMAILIRNIGVLGDTIALYALPSFEIHKLVTFFQAINRVEIIFAVELIVIKFFKVSLLYYVSVLAFSRLFGLKSYKPIVFVMGALLAAYSILVYESTIDHLAGAQSTEVFLWTLFEFLLPLITLLLAKARKLPQKAGGDHG